MKKQSSIELIEEKIKFQMKLAQMDKNNGVDWSMSVVIKQLEQLYFDVCEQSKELHKQEIIEAREKAPNLNAWEFDILKRVVRCRKKGQFKEDLEKTKRVIDLYLKEFEK